MTHSYQLTPYPVGSKREFWTMSWPIMLAMISSTLMVFVDRVFLSRYHPLALNALASASIAYYIFLGLPMAIAAISEVLVGRLHGEERHKEVGSAVWQMVWFSVCLTPVFALAAWGMPFLLFSGSEIELYQTAYFRILMCFAPIQCAAIALSGFFVGIGKVRVVTISACLGNMANAALGYVLIFGWGKIPSFGISGAAFAAGCSQMIQMLFLLGMMLREKMQAIYATARCAFHRHFLAEGLKIGTPSGLGHTIEIIGHFVFFQVVMGVGQVQMTVVAIVQSFYILCSFINDAGSKAASAIVSNLLGADRRGFIPKVLAAAFSLQILYFALLAIVLCVFSDGWSHLFLSHRESSQLIDPMIGKTFLLALLYMTVFFLFDGFSWILIGFLTAAGDTRFIFWVSLVIHWGAYIVPTILFIGMRHGGADTAWAIIAAMSAVHALVYICRYKTGGWLKNYKNI